MSRKTISDIIMLQTEKISEKILNFYFRRYVFQFSFQDFLGLQLFETYNFIEISLDYLVKILEFERRLRITYCISNKSVIFMYMKCQHWVRVMLNKTVLIKGVVLLLNVFQTENVTWKMYSNENRNNATFLYHLFVFKHFLENTFAALFKLHNNA